VEAVVTSQRTVSSPERDILSLLRNFSKLFGMFSRLSFSLRLSRKNYFFQILKIAKTDVLLRHKEPFLVQNEIFYPFWDFVQNFSECFKDWLVLQKTIAKKKFLSKLKNSKN
jgi:hypothetical protein